MKIVVISTPIFRMPVAGYSGLEHLAWLTAKGLAEKGHSVSLIGPDGSECPGVEMMCCGPERGLDEKGFYQKYWQELPKFDAIIDHSWQKWSLMLKVEGKLKAPVLSVCHAPVNTMFGSLPPNIDKPCFVCISQDQADHFQALFGKLARVAHNGVDMDVYKSIGIPRSDRFLFLARFSTIKGPDLAIEACRKAGVGLDLVGDTSITNEPELLERCKKMADGKQIKMIGPASRGQCVWWFSQAHCLLHPNQRFREPFGLAPVEALACGTPVIAWNYGAMRETVGEKGMVGSLVASFDDLVNAITYWAKGVKDMATARRICRLQAEQFSLPKMIDRYEELCKEAIEGGGW